MARTQNQELISALCECASTCDSCAYNVCLGEPKMEQAGQACMDCAQICWATASLVSRGSQCAAWQISECAEACQQCAAECQQHSRSQELQQCAQVCQACAQVCQQVPAPQAVPAR